MRKTTALLVLTIFVLGIFYPAIFAGVNSLDDFRMLDGLPKSGNLDVFTLFNPAHAIGYFRPLIVLSYYIDNSLLDLPPQAMHLENILLHLLNSLLVLRIGLSLFRKLAHSVELAFLAACIFALHPLNVEAVAWVSGRTDLLATLFALLAIVCTCCFIAKGRLIWLWYGAIICVIGALAKETALFCLPAAYLLAVAQDEDIRSALVDRRYRCLFSRGSAMVVPFLLSGLTYLSCRLTTLKIVTQIAAAPGGGAVAPNPLHARIALLNDALTTYGFYLKKLFLPLPLNFAITGVSPLYFWPGSAAMILVLYLCVIRRKNSIALQMTLACLCVMLSALVISRAGIAWTPYAERYLYLPSVFFALGIVDAGYRIVLRVSSPRFSQIAVFVLLALTAVITAKRVTIWQDNLTLYQDTIRKSPDFAPISNELAIALNEKNRPEDALKQLEAGKKAKKEGDMALLYVNQAAILGGQKKFDEAYKVLARTHRGKGIDTAHIEVVKTYIHLMERDQLNTKDTKRAERLVARLADLHEIYYKRSGDTDHLYRAGQLALAGKNRAKAHRFFTEVADKAPKESMYKEFASKMAGKTETQTR